MAAEPHINKITRPISERVRQLQPSGIRRFFDLLATMEDTISLGVGEPDYATPWHIREAAIYSLEKGDTMYTSNAGMPELRREIAAYLNKNYGLDYDPESQILITVGVSEALDLAARAIINPGDEVIIPDPSYVSYSPCVSLAGGKPVMVPTSQRDNFEVDPAAIGARVTDATKAILIGYPANPTGAVMPRQKLEQLAVTANARNLLVISDEIYARVIYDTEHTCFAALPGMQERTVLLGGFSKAWAMTGWRIGYAAAPAEIIAAMTKIHQYTMLCAPIMGQKAALEALKGGDADISDMVEDYNHRRLVMVEGLNDIGLSCFEPKGAFYAFPSIQSTGLSSEEFAEKLLIEEKVAVVPGDAFGECGQGYVRCCYATQLSDIEEALSRMKRFVGKHRA
jgi:aminotransferase